MTDALGASWLSAAGYDAVLFDLDGVLYVGAEAVAGAVDAVSGVVLVGTTIGYVTNNASRTPQVVADHLGELGYPASPSNIVTSAQAAAGLVRAKCGPGSRVLVVGAPALAEAVTEADLLALTSAGEQPEAVVQGFSSALTYDQLAEGALAIRAGAWWVATNIDTTLPTPRGLLPGNGALVRALAVATDTEPVVAGKPERPLFDEAVRRTGAGRPLFVGDRLDTDIAGARAWGMDAALVLTGVAGLHDVMRAEQAERPTYVATTLAALFDEIPARLPGPNVSGWRVDVDHGRLQVTGEGTASSLAAALCTVAWEIADHGEAWEEVVGVDLEALIGG